MIYGIQQFQHPSGIPVPDSAVLFFCWLVFHAPYFVNVYFQSFRPTGIFVRMIFYKQYKYYLLIKKYDLFHVLGRKLICYKYSIIYIDNNIIQVQMFLITSKYGHNFYSYFQRNMTSKKLVLFEALYGSQITYMCQQSIFNTIHSVLL